MAKQANTYPTPKAIIRLVKPTQKLGKDQAARVEHVRKAIASIKSKKQKPTAEPITHIIPEGRRTLRRAVCAGAVQWGAGDTKS